LQTEPQAREKYGDENVKVYKTSFTALYYSMMEPDQKEPTAMKLIVTGPEERVVGLHLIGLGSDEMLQGFSVALKMGGTSLHLVPLPDSDSFPSNFRVFPFFRLPPPPPPSFFFLVHVCTIADPSACTNRSHEEGFRRHSSYSPYVVGGGRYDALSHGKELRTLEAVDTALTSSSNGSLVSPLSSSSSFVVVVLSLFSFPLVSSRWNSSE
jgi:hypothetical protein